jgi:hypothetical protein
MIYGTRPSGVGACQATRQQLQRGLDLEATRLSEQR